jgi:hypothetical protein
MLLAASLAQQKRSGPPPTENKIPEGARLILEQADKFELLSLDASWSTTQGGFHDHQILGRREIVDSATRKTLISALENGVAENHGEIAMCFNPRHGIRVNRRGKRVDFLICFECAQVKIFGDEKGSFLVSQSPQRVFNKVLSDSHIPLPQD